MTPDERARAGGAVAERMKELELTTVQLAQKAGLDPGTVRSVITGRHWPTEATREKIAAALGWEVGDVARHAMSGHLSLEHLPTAALIEELCRRFDVDSS